MDDVNRRQVHIVNSLMLYVVQKGKLGKICESEREAPFGVV